MVKIRLIPVLLLQNGLLVRAERFRHYQILGNPLVEVERFNQWNVDELIYLDISRDDFYEERRSDQNRQELTDSMKILESVSKRCFMPLTWGGRIKNTEDMRARFVRGADKITINTMAFRRPELIEEGARLFGSQAIVVSIDSSVEGDKNIVMIDAGRTRTSLATEDWAKRAEDCGAGEILLTSVDRDGTGEGYDLELINAVSKHVSIPIIACGGAGSYADYVRAVEAGASAVAAANIYHFKELSDYHGKKTLFNAGINVRFVEGEKR